MFLFPSLSPLYRAFKTWGPKSAFTETLLKRGFRGMGQGLKLF